MDMLTIIFCIIFLLLLGFLPTFMYRRAALQIIEIFRKYRAVGQDRALSLEDLGLRPPGSRQQLFRKRDYRPKALQALIQASIIIPTEGGRYYLAEDKIKK